MLVTLCVFVTLGGGLVAVCGLYVYALVCMFILLWVAGGRVMSLKLVVFVCDQAPCRGAVVESVVLELVLVPPTLYELCVRGWP